MAAPPPGKGSGDDGGGGTGLWRRVGRCPCDFGSPARVCQVPLETLYRNRCDRSGDSDVERHDTLSALQHSQHAIDTLFGAPAERSFDVRYWDGTVEAAHDGAVPFTLVIKTPSALRQMLLPPTELSIVEAYLSGVVDVEGELSAAVALGDAIKGRLSSVRALVSLTRDLLALPSPNGGARRRSRAARRRESGAGRRQARAIARSRGDQLPLRRRQRLLRALAGQANGVFVRLFPPRRRHPRRGAGSEARSCVPQAAAGARRPLPRHRDADGARSSSTPRCTTASPRSASRSARGRRSWRRSGSRRRDSQIAAASSCATIARLAAIGPFDKIASIGMVEHVGVDHLPAYFASAYAALAPGGLFLNHGIVSVQEGRPRRWRDLVLRRLWKVDAFIDQYVFPDGKLGPFYEVIQAAEAVGFETRDVESLREHYARTLGEWLDAARSGIMTARRRSSARPSSACGGCT